MAKSKFLPDQKELLNDEHYIANPAFILSESGAVLSEHFGDVFDKLPENEQIKLQVQFSSTLANMYGMARVWEQINASKNTN